MVMKSPRSRDEYDLHLKKLGRTCAFCSNAIDYGIKKYLYWRWDFSAFPYKKFHTLIIPDRHILLFSDLTKDELEELAEITDEVKSLYHKSNIVSIDSLYGDQLQFFWLHRANVESKVPVAHLHINVIPTLMGDCNILLDNDSHSFDMRRLTDLL